MEQYQEFTGKTPEEAVEAGLKALGLTRDQAEIKILEQGKRKLFGSIPARVAVWAKPAEPAPEAPAETPVAAQKAAPAELPKEAPAKAEKAQETREKAPKGSDGARAVAFLEGIFPLIGIEARPVLVSEEEKIVINLQSESSKGVIGRRGELIDALQALAGAVANTGRKEYKRVVVDCENYREEREETLRHVAEKSAAKAVRLGKRIRLEPMNPYERRIIHSALVDSEEVTTKSEGKEPMRYVVIIPKQLKNDRRGGRDRDRRNGKPYGNGNRGKVGKYGEKKYGERKPYPKRELPKDATPESSGTSFNRGGTPGYKKGGFSGFFGTYLGKGEDETPTPADPKEES